VIPITSALRDKDALEGSFKAIEKELKEGEMVCIFPEGKLTRNGEMNKFRPGIERIIKQTPCPVIPIGLDGLWGSLF